MERERGWHPEKRRFKKYLGREWLSVVPGREVNKRRDLACMEERAVIAEWGPREARARGEQGNT